jgi:hypothetical protein
MKSYENNENFRENENVWENGRRKREILWNILRCQIRMVLQNKSDNSNGQIHALLYCLLRMVLQNKSDNSNGHALKWSNFRLNFSFLSQKRTHFRENFLGNVNFRETENFRDTKFREFSRKFAHFRIIFAFRENWKNRFRFNPTCRHSVRALS